MSVDLPGFGIFDWSKGRMPTYGDEHMADTLALPTKPKKKKSKTVNAIPGYRPLPTGPAMVGDIRAPGIVDMPQRDRDQYRHEQLLDMAANLPASGTPNFDLTIPEFRRRKKSDDSIEAVGGPVDSEPMFSNPTEVREDTFLSRTLAPDPDELEAARNGMRWHWALEHRFMPPGSKWNETVWNGVDRENKYLASLLKQRDLGSNVASERQRSTMANMWKTFLADIRNGHFDAYGGTADSAKEWAAAFRARYNSLFGEGADVDLAPEAEVLGKRSDITKKVVTDYQSMLSYTQDAMDNIYNWYQDGSWEDPTKQAFIKNYLDKVSQALAAELGGDSKSMADAEKQRIQILSLPEQSMELVKQEIAGYRDFLSSVMDYGRQKGWSQDIIGRLNRTKDWANKALAANGKGNISTFVKGFIKEVEDILPSLSPQERELAVGLGEVLQAGKLAHDTYMQNMMLAADVDPSYVYQQAEYLYNLTVRKYNDYMENEAKRPERAKELPKREMDYKDLSKKVIPSELLTPTDYKKLIVEYLKPETKGGNPQANIEQGNIGGIITPSDMTKVKTISISEGDLI